MQDKSVIAIGGENLIDRVRTIDADGVPVVADKLGGSPYNVAVGLGRQEANVHFLTPISTDELGDRLAEHLVDAGVQIAAPRRTEPTTLASVTVTDGIPEYEFSREGTAERCVTVESVEASLPADTAILHIGSLALVSDPDASVWEDVCVRAKSRGVFITLDPNVRLSLIEDIEAYSARIKRLFDVADLIKLSDEDIEPLFPELNQKAALSAMRASYDAGLIVLTKGPDGVEGYTSNTDVTLSAAPVSPLVDTIGAGDTFMATLLASVAREKLHLGSALSDLSEDDLRVLLTRAGTAAALNCEKEGCDPPSSSAIDAALNRSST